MNLASLRYFYLPIKVKFLAVLCLSAGWVAVSIILAKPWFNDLEQITGPWLATLLIGSIAILPGFMNAFILWALLFDKRPPHKVISDFPNVTILIAAYNEAEGIHDTLHSISVQNYPAPIKIIVINDGSTDDTAQIVEGYCLSMPELRLVNFDANHGKSNALNNGLEAATTDLVITVDADCFLKNNAVWNLVTRYLSDPPNTAAVAGEILIRNSRKNWITKAQEWDYFLGIAAVKRAQSLFQGTLVAQGAFSLYEKKAVLALGGWPAKVGEDIVLTWALLNAGYRIGHAEDACAFTQCPDTLKKFIRQRQRWSRGLIEAFKSNPTILLKPRLSTLYIWWNAFFPLMDVIYTCAFLPGVVLGLFGYFWIVGPMTVALVPVALLLNYIMFHASKTMFEDQSLEVRRNIFGFVFYMLAYGLILQPACVLGYMSEFFSLRKSWGTK